MNKSRFFLPVIIVLFTLTGCMFPEEKLMQNQVPYKDQLDSVQSAVDQYKEANGGLLPIKTRDAKTPIYQKYPIEFKKVVPKFIAEPPGNAFESGGLFQYVLVDAETNPTVKLLDLRMADTIREIKMRIKANGYPPFKDQIAENVYTIDFKKIGYQEEPVAVSPFTNQNLHFVISTEGEIYVDYRSDLFQAMKSSGKELKEGEDIRGILVENSMFVPAYSLPYTIDKETNEPVFLAK
ncbi:hypothetical protein QNH36_15705 [Mesobacillus sp. AQ2]|jgi:hypothetical protein|uniref:hypothetical protein n=1 Tax=Bacillaceae TaxID=186817 RepID=UPI00119D3CEE|nr:MULTISPECIES: hypothetical protein [Bacillaceae]MCM3122206.1 hypothetical protein [Mesobacillus sp. MER 33]MCM3232170.1 hypothetical protein [Mesobacillus sp. MER 48]WHX39120.1 hypothetical protein QNH36_15705 [Mesobacillus sp. AQ2]